MDAVRSLDEDQKGILAAVIARVGMSHIATCLAVIKSSGDPIRTEDDLTSALHQFEILAESNLQANIVDASGNAAGVEEMDVDFLASLLIKCYPDMPQAAADALVGSEVMAPSLQVVASARHALWEAKSDFVITALYTLFEEKLDEIEQVIAKNPAFIKAMQLGRPGWNPINSQRKSQ